MRIKKSPFIPENSSKKNFLTVNQPLTWIYGLSPENIFFEGLPHFLAVTFFINLIK